MVLLNRITWFMGPLNTWMTKKNNVDTEHLPGCLLALYICNSDLRRWKKAGGGVVWRSEQQPEQSPNCQNHVVVKFFHPRGFDSWRGLLLLASTTWEVSEPRGVAMQTIIVQWLLLLIIIGLPSLLQVAWCVNDLWEINTPGFSPLLKIKFNMG